MLRRSRRSLPTTIACGLVMILVLTTGIEGVAEANPQDNQQARGWRNPDDVSGPLGAPDRRCGRREFYTDRGRRPDIEVKRYRIAIIRWCITLYRFDPLMETDLFRDYGVIWLQTHSRITKRGRGRWCFPAETWGIGLVSGDQTDVIARFEEATPREHIESVRKRDVEAHLTVDAGGSALQEASISRTFRMYGITNTRMRGRTLEFNWWKDRRMRVGERMNPGPMHFATGAVVSWPSELIRDPFSEEKEISVDDFFVFLMPHTNYCRQPE